MFFVASKLLDFFLTPSNIIAAIAVAGVLFLTLGWRSTGVRLLAASALLLAVLGWSAIGPAALETLESRFPQPAISGPVTGIILVGGAIDTHLTGERGQVALNEGGERLTTVAALSRRYPGARVFLSGGASHITSTKTISESAAAQMLLIELGVPEARIEMEERSRNTCENASESAATLRPQTSDQWILVTSASHMPRAIACFRAHAFPVVAYPVDFRTLPLIELPLVSSPISQGLAALDLAAHEWVGLATYRVFGLTKEFFPAP